MVIQRWQSVYLFLASIMMGLFSFIRLASKGDGESLIQFSAIDEPVYFTINILIMVLLFLAIFMFKNIKRQKTVTLIAILMIVASIVSGGIIVYRGDLNIEWTGGILIICAIVEAIAAYRRMVADERLLKSYDRIR